MSKIAIAFSSFVAGVICVFIFGPNTPPTFASSDGQIPLQSNRMIFKGGGVKGGGKGVAMEATPIFRPLEQMPIFEDFSFSNTTQPLDGLDCRGCTFEDTTLEYSGGAYNLENLKVSGTTQLILKGSAANTDALVQLLHSFGVGIPSKSPKPNMPLKKKTKAKHPLSNVDFTPPFLGGK